MDEELELRNPFPAPPTQFARYTDANMKLLSLLREREGENNISGVDGVAGPSTDIGIEPRIESKVSVDLESQAKLLHDQAEVPMWELTELEPPRVDWINEDGGLFRVFGNLLKVDVIHDQTIAEQGGTQLFPEDRSVDRRPAMLALLKSMLVTYSSLTKSLLSPPPPPSRDPDAAMQYAEWQPHNDWLRILSENLIAAANDLRPLQARVNMEQMLRSQLDTRRAETAEIHAKCDSLESRLGDLRSEMASIAAADQVANGDHPHSGADDAMQTDHQIPVQSPVVVMEDVYRWAEEVV